MSSPPLRPVSTASRPDDPARMHVCCWCEPERAAELAVVEDAAGIRFAMCGDCVAERIRALDTPRAGLRLAR